MSDKVYEIESYLDRDDPSVWVTHLWDNYSTQRMVKMDQWSELKRYLFAVDTKDTSNATLPWENTTTLPKLCQIRDTLYANYKSALFPNDKWLKWEAYTEDSAKKETADTITGYMENKTREGNYRSEIDRMLYDYIDYGNAFATVDFEARYNKDDEGIIPSFIGPKSVRISPQDIVFNPTADSIENSFKIIRSIKTLGELKKLADTNPNQKFWLDVVEKRLKIRRHLGGITREDADRVFQYQIEGFGNLQEYFQSEFVEILEFYGDFHNTLTGTLETDRMITVVDRSMTVRNVDIPTYSGRAPIRHVGWRRRPDNLWAMGPLDNLVGMQYRIDHLENAKADAFDLAIHTPLAIRGDVEPFIWGPKAVIHIDTDGGDVSELNKSIQAVIQADTEIEFLENKMEMFAGAPREAAGIRTPGEKTAFEVDQLQSAAGRLFQVKIVDFEIQLMEPNLNDMLETAHRNFDGSDIIRTVDDDLGATQFTAITKGDITAKGILRPVGARHFAQKAKELQNLIGISGSALWALMAPHISGLGLVDYIEDVLDLRGYSIFGENIAVMEQQETASLTQQAGEDLEVEASAPLPEEVA